MLCSIVWYIYYFLNIVLMVIDVFSTVYFYFRNYHNSVVVFVSENTVPLLFPMKNVKVKIVESFAGVSDRFHPYSFCRLEPSLRPPSSPPPTRSPWGPPLRFSPRTPAARAGGRSPSWRPPTSLLARTRSTSDAPAQGQPRRAAACEHLNLSAPLPSPNLTAAALLF